MHEQVQPPGNGFASFEMPSKKMPDSEITRYRVYSSPKDFKLVEADNAAEAMVAADIGIPYKVVREMPLYASLISPRLIGLGLPKKEKVAVEVSAAPASSDAAVEAPVTTLLPGGEGKEGEAATEGTEAAAAAVADAPTPDQDVAQAVGAAVSEAAGATLSQDEINKLLEE